MKSPERPLTTTGPKQSKKKIEKGLGHWAHDGIGIQSTRK